MRPETLRRPSNAPLRTVPHPVSWATMKILHTADWHLGQQLHGFDRTAEHRAVLTELLEMVTRREIDAVLLAGDVYHASNPPLSAQRLFFEFLQELSERAPMTDFVAIAGNHDSGPRLELPTALGLAARHTLIGSTPRVDGAPRPENAVVPLTDRSGEVRAVVAAMPYPRPGDLDGLPDAPQTMAGGASEPPPHAPLRRYFETAAAAAQARWPGAPLIAMAHLHIVGGRTSALSERRILIGGEEAAPLAIFPQSAAYVALGHLHRPQRITGAVAARYAGAPMPLSTDEAAHQQSVVELGLPPRAGDSPPKITILPLSRPRAFLRLPEAGAAAAAEVEARIGALDLPDAALPETPPFLEISVALTTPDPDLRRRVDAALAGRRVRLIKLGVSRPEAETTNTDREPHALGGAGRAASPTPREAFAALHRARFGGPPDAALAAAFDTLAASVDNEDAIAAADVADVETAPLR